ncbi:MAG TPA: GNAT family N-acetyltransferase [Salinarimonas sp.]|nr:GNAT family N-acetyltransferase [Salinarimonas sp.]
MSAVLSLRPAAPADLPAVRDLLTETWHATYDAIHGAAKVAEVTAAWHSVEALERSLHAPGAVFLVAERDGVLVGTSLAAPDGEGGACLRRLYVRPGAQGTGVGRCLLDATLAPFREVPAWLEVEPGNARAVAFYERHGFAREPGQGACGGRDDLSAIRMTRRPRADLVLRPVRDDDAQDLYGLLTLCFADYPGCFTDPHGDLPDLRAPATAIARKPGGAYWVVEDARGRVGACVAVDVPEPGTAELHRLYVRPDLRRRGLAERLTRLAEDHAAAVGARCLVLWSDTRFTDAHRLYERLGYVRGPRSRDLGDVSNSVEYFFEKAIG